MIQNGILITKIQALLSQVKALENENQTLKDENEELQKYKNAFFVLKGDYELPEE